MVNKTLKEKQNKQSAKNMKLTNLMNNYNKTSADADKVEALCYSNNPDENNPIAVTKNGMYSFDTTKDSNNWSSMSSAWVPASFLKKMVRNKFNYLWKYNDIVYGVRPNGLYTICDMANKCEKVHLYDVAGWDRYCNTSDINRSENTLIIRYFEATETYIDTDGKTKTMNHNIRPSEVRIIDPYVISKNTKSSHWLKRPNGTNFSRYYSNLSTLVHADIGFPYVAGSKNGKTGFNSGNLMSRTVGNIAFGYDLAHHHMYTLYINDQRWKKMSIPQVGLIKSLGLYNEKTPYCDCSNYAFENSFEELIEINRSGAMIVYPDFSVVAATGQGKAVFNGFDAVMYLHKAYLQSSFK